MEKDIPHKHESKSSWSENQDCNRVNLSGGCTRPKCDEPKSSFKVCEAKLAKPKGEIDPEL